MEKRLVLFLMGLMYTVHPYAQNSSALIQKVKTKLEQVSSYEADGIMKTNVSFLKVPEASVKVYYKKPGKLKIKNENGISLVPKGTIAISLNNLFNGDFTALDAGSATLKGMPVKVVKLLPVSDSAEIVLSTLYIDESLALILKARTTTRENGTYEVEMEYGKYKAFGLPDKVICTFNTQDYKLPKGITFDYDDGSTKKNVTAENTKGKVEITYSKYAINKNIPDAFFWIADYAD